MACNIVLLSDSLVEDISRIVRSKALQLKCYKVHILISSKIPEWKYEKLLPVDVFIEEHRTIWPNTWHSRQAASQNLRICYIKPLKYFTNLNKSEAVLILFQLYFQKRVSWNKGIWKQHEPYYRGQRKASNVAASKNYNCAILYATQIWVPWNSVWHSSLGIVFIKSKIKIVDRA